MIQNELKSILEKHTQWICNEGGGEKADLREANLSGADLRWANLSGADLREANLRWANLRRADLREANLRSADLREANLSSADLREANLREANLSWADLSWANLRSADLIIIHPGPWEMIVSKTHIHVGCERFLNDKNVETAMRQAAKKHNAQDFLKLYIKSLEAANKLMKLSAASAKKEKGA